MHIDEHEVLRYLGYKNQQADENTQRLIEDCLHEIRRIAREKYVYDFFALQREGDQLFLLGSTLVFGGKDISNHLKDSLKCAVMAVTLGIEVDQRLAYYAKMNLSRGIVLDACATAAVESLCDAVENEIRAKAAEEGLEITARYSPGYGDFSLELQHKIVHVLDAYRKIGLSVTESSLLVPRKSVTAVIGLQDKPAGCRQIKCMACLNQECQYRKGGERCE